MLGAHPAMQQVYAQAHAAARTSFPVVLVGETGTGKELVARAIHQLSARAAGPLIAVNAAAIPDGTFESELFGHVRGGFTSADRARRGYLRQAHGGTFVLDEALSLPPHHQAKLLRAIETGHFWPVGSDREATSDFRLIAAMQTDVWAACAMGAVRSDFWYRVRGVEIVLPPLRERATDIPLLAEAFLREGAQDNGQGRAPILTAAALDRLRAHSWPGNVRELRWLMLRVGHMPADGPLTAARIEALLAANEPDTASAEQGEARRALVVAVLESTAGDTREAARVLGISRSQLYRRMSRLGIAPPLRCPYSHRCE